MYTKFESPQLGSCNYWCAYRNRVVGTSVFLVHLHCRDFSFLYFFLRAHKNANKRISGFSPLDVFLRAFFIFVRL